MSDRVYFCGECPVCAAATEVERELLSKALYGNVFKSDGLVVCPILATERRKATER